MLGSVVVVSSVDEWMAAILGCSAKMDANNQFEIKVDLGCYGKTELLTVNCEIHGANESGQKVTVTPKSEFFDPTEEEKTITFTSDDFGGEHLYSCD